MALLSLLLGLNLISFQVSALEPAHWCSERCSPEQKQIEELFQAAKFNPSQIEPSLYTGHCYHSPPSHNPNYAHHGVYYFSGIPDVNGQMRIHGSGRFKFFGTGYENMTLEQAQAEFVHHAEDSRVLKPLESSYLADFSSGDEIIRYWFRHSEDLAHVYLLGQWSNWNYFFCDLKKH